MKTAVLQSFSRKSATFPQNLLEKVYLCAVCPFFLLTIKAICGIL